MKGGRSVFLGGHEKFVKIFHEIVLKIFDGPQNIFFCSASVILIFKLRESEHKMSKLAIKEI